MPKDLLKRPFGQFRGLFAPYLKWVKIVLETSVMVDPSLVVMEVIINHISHGHRSFCNKGVQHELLVARSVVAAHVFVLAHVGARATGVRIARVVLKKNTVFFLSLNISSIIDMGNLQRKYYKDMSVRIKNVRVQCKDCTPRPRRPAPRRSVRRSSRRSRPCSPGTARSTTRHPAKDITVLTLFRLWRY